MTNLEQYYKKIDQEVKTRMLASEDGGTKEQIFTRLATDLLKSMDETDNVSISYDAKTDKKKRSHKINAFSISDDLQTLDLFVTKFYASPKLVGLTEEDMEEQKELVCNFYKKCVEDEYSLHIAESSEIFDCAHELGYNEEFRDNLSQIRVFVLSNGTFCGDEPEPINLCGTKTSFRVIDIDYLYKISEDAKAPVDVNFQERGYKIPCITGGEDNDIYQAYIAIVPGRILADLYREFGVRLMEDNVRQFLQFTGKINKGIKETIDNHPEMFLAYNNGIAATASDITLDKNKRYITSISDLQIVNGGQTTASLYHAWLENHEIDLSRIHVQVKFSVIKKTEEYDNIVGNISRCANTQNKVNETDFSANDERLVRIEKMSRGLVAPETKMRPYATYWYFERAKGQYKNFRLKDGFTRAREKQFDLKYPKDQMFTKQDLAKYINTYNERVINDRYIVGPHIVCRGNEKNFAAFIKYNIPDASSIDNIYYEDAIAKAILFMDADRRYGTKASGEYIGDLKKSVVPYAIALLKYITDGNLDLYKIWRAQMVSPELSDFIYNMMKELNRFIVDSCNERGITRYEEWCKKEECWNEIRNHTWNFRLYKIEADLIDPNTKTKRKSITKTEDEKLDAQFNKEYVEAIPYEIWDKIVVWGEESGLLNIMQIVTSKEISRKLRTHTELTDADIEKGLIIADILAKNNINLLYEADSFAEQSLDVPDRKKITHKEIKRLIDRSLMYRMYEWNKSRNILKAHVREAIENAIHFGEEPNYKMTWAIYYGLLDLEARGFER